jgi:hypothetical protein
VASPIPDAPPVTAATIPSIFPIGDSSSFQLHETPTMCMASAPCKCAQIAFLAFAGLIVGTDPAVDGDL